MTNNLLLFVLFYFGVVFVAILGLFWNDMRFFGLAVINFFALSAFLLTSALSKKSESTKEEVKTPAHHQEKIEKEEKITHHSQAAAHHSQFVKYPYMKQNKKSHTFFRWLYSKFYLIILIALGLVIVWAGVQLSYKYNLCSKITTTFSSVYSSLFEKENQDPYLYTGVGSVIGTGIITGEAMENVVEESGVVINSQINDIFLGDTESGTLQQPVVENPSSAEVTSAQAIKEKLGITTTSNVSLINALVYLIDVNGIVTSSKTSLTFKYVTSKNPYYKYFATAYEKQIVGASTNPSTKISCDTYQVFKGMLEGWKLTYTAANVKSVFRTEAQKRNVLNGCVKGKLVKGENL